VSVHYAKERDACTTFAVHESGAYVHSPFAFQAPISIEGYSHAVRETGQEISFGFKGSKQFVCEGDIDSILSALQKSGISSRLVPATAVEVLTEIMRHVLEEVAGGGLLRDIPQCVDGTITTFKGFFLDLSFVEEVMDDPVAFIRRALYTDEWIRSFGGTGAEVSDVIGPDGTMRMLKFTPKRRVHARTSLLMPHATMPQTEHAVSTYYIEGSLSPTEMARSLNMGTCHASRPGDTILTSTNGLFRPWESIIGLCVHTKIVKAEDGDGIYTLAMIIVIEAIATTMWAWASDMVSSKPNPFPFLEARRTLTILRQAVEVGNNEPLRRLEVHYRIFLMTGMFPTWMRSTPTKKRMMELMTQEEISPVAFHYTALTNLARPAAYLSLPFHRFLAEMGYVAPTEAVCVVFTPPLRSARAVAVVNAGSLLADQVRMALGSGPRARAIVTRHPVERRDTHGKRQLRFDEKDEKHEKSTPADVIRRRVFDDSGSSADEGPQAMATVSSHASEFNQQLLALRGNQFEENGLSGVTYHSGSLSDLLG
jgi:hypothetical protein